MGGRVLVSALMLFALGGAAHAQSAVSSDLATKQQLGRRLFGQDCGICHTPPTITSGTYGPVLSKDMVQGNEPAIRDFISHGSDRMPGFQYYYTPAQIDAIVDYLDTVPKPGSAKASTGAGAGMGAE